MLLILLLVSAIVLAEGTKPQRRTLSDADRYAALTTSLTALEANPTPGNLAKIQLILKSTDYLTLQSQFGTGPSKKRFKFKIK